MICGSCGARVPSYHRFGTRGAPVKGRRLSSPQPTAIYESVAPTVQARLVRVQAGEGWSCLSPDSSTQGVGRDRGEILFQVILILAEARIFYRERHLICP